MYWGNPQLWFVKLNDDMVSYDRSIGQDGIVSVEMTPDAFGFKEDRDGKTATTYTEGPWFYHRKGLYYMIYAAAGIPECIAYSTSTSPEGPWSYRGYIMDRASHLAFTNHSGVIDFQGNSYFFYHSHALSHGEGFKRSVSVEQFQYNKDGSIPLITPTMEGVKSSHLCLNPFQQVEAETMAWSEGVKTSSDCESGVYVTKIDSGDCILIRNVDLKKGATLFEANVASVSEGGKIEIRKDNPDGQLLGILHVKHSHGCLNWMTQSCKLTKTNGIHDLCFVFTGPKGNLFNFNWWRLK